MKKCIAYHFGERSHHAASSIRASNPGPYDTDKFEMLCLQKLLPRLEEIWVADPPWKSSPLTCWRSYLRRWIWPVVLVISVRVELGGMLWASEGGGRSPRRMCFHHDQG